MRSDTIKKGFERAPHRSLLKATGVDPKMLVFEGPAVIFESQDEACEGILGGTRGATIGHVSPEAAAGGTIALVRPGDRIRLDIPARKLDLLVPEAEFAERRSIGQLPPREKPVGSLGKYASLATSAGTGAILKW